MPAGSIGTVGIIDETSAEKKGTKTPGVQRQYLGCVGKVANGIVTVHLTVARGPFKAMLDGELYLPESWEQDRERCRAADIPDDVRYRSKWWIALELIGRAEGNGWAFDWFTFDEWYGGKPGFLSILDLTDQQYVGEVPKTFSCRPGRRQTPTSAEAVFSQANLRNRAPRSFRIEQQTGPPTVWQAKAVDVCLGEARRPQHRLIWARNRETGEVKYFIARTRRRTSLRRLLHVAFTRWNVEHMFRVAKSEVGLTHFEGRSYVSLKRHLALCLVALAFVALHTMRLRGEKSGGDVGASVPSIEANLPAIPEPAAGNE
jgi:SRSO17 transposase